MRVNACVSAWDGTCLGAMSLEPELTFLSPNVCVIRFLAMDLNRYPCTSYAAYYSTSRRHGRDDQAMYGTP